MEGSQNRQIESLDRCGADFGQNDGYRGSGHIIGQKTPLSPCQQAPQIRFFRITPDFNARMAISSRDKGINGLFMSNDRS
jgi:hypothetical protein